MRQNSFVRTQLNGFKDCYLTEDLRVKKNNHTHTHTRRVKIQGNENIDKYLDIAGMLKKLGNMKGTVISIVVDAL